MTKRNREVSGRSHLGNEEDKFGVWESGKMTRHLGRKCLEGSCRLGKQVKGL